MNNSEPVITAVFVVLFLAGVVVLALGAFMWAKAITGAHNATMNAKQAADFVAPAYVEEREEEPAPKQRLRTQTRMADLTDDDLTRAYLDDDDEDEAAAERRAARDEREGKVRTMDENSGYDDERAARVPR